MSSYPARDAGNGSDHKNPLDHRSAVGLLSTSVRVPGGLALGHLSSESLQRV
jgi:hypothetical protein